MKKRFVSILFAIAVIMSCFTMLASAEEKTNSIMVITKYKDAAISGPKVSVYRIADYKGGNKIVLNDTYTKYNIDVDVSTSDKLDSTALSIYSCIAKDNIPATKTGTTDTNGKVKIDNLTDGYYLIAIDTYKNVDRSTYTFSPFIVVLPEFDDSKGINKSDIEVYPKAKFNECTDYDHASVVIIWDDPGLESSRPTSITINLLCDDKIFDTVVLSDANNWKYSWDKLEPGHKWVVSEAEMPDGYSFKQSEEDGNHFEIEHAKRITAPEETTTEAIIETTTVLEIPETTEEETKRITLPVTGQLWWPIPVFAALGIMFVAFGMAIKKKNEE